MKSESTSINERYSDFQLLIRKKILTVCLLTELLDLSKLKSKLTRTHLNLLQLIKAHSILAYSIAHHLQTTESLDRSVEWCNYFEAEGVRSFFLSYLWAIWIFTPSIEWLNSQLFFIFFSLFCYKWWFLAYFGTGVSHTLVLSFESKSISNFRSVAGLWKMTIKFKKDKTEK